MPDPSCPTKEQLRQLLDEQLDPSDCDWIQQHVSECASCQQELDSLTNASAEVLGSVTWDAPDLANTSQALDALLDRLRQSPPDFETAPLSALRADDVEDQTQDAPQFPGEQTAAAPLGQIDNYEIIEQIGSGGSGYIFKARDRRLGRLVALKVLRQELSSVETARARFEREARTAAALEHDNIVTIFEVATPNDFPPYLVMELIEGQSLKDRLWEAPNLEPSDAATFASQIARGLAAAHEAGLVHRDIKSANIMLEQKTGRAKITDFGLAREIETDTDITIDGMIAGTPAYMSPEQIVRPQEGDGRTNIYSLGILLYELLTGERPFRGVVRMVLQQSLNEEPLPLRWLNDRIPRDLETICLKAIEKEPSRRYQTAAEFADDLDRWIEGRPVLARPIGIGGRFWRWCQRNPRFAGLYAIVLTVLVAGAIDWSKYVLSLERARNSAVVARQEADRSARTAADQLDLVLKSHQALIYLVQDALEDKPGLQPLRQRLLRLAMDGLKEANRSAESAPAVLSMAIAQNRMADVFEELGEMDEAKRSLSKALAISRALSKQFPDKIEVKQALAYTLWNLGDISVRSDELEQAEPYFSEALELSQQAAKSVSSSTIAQRNLSIAYDRMGDVRARQRRFSDAFKCYELGLGIARKLAIRHQDDSEFKRDVAIACLKLGALCYREKKRSEAERFYKEGHEFLTQVTGAAPQDLRLQRDLAVSYTRIAELAEATNEWQLAFEMLIRSNEILLRLSKRSPNQLDLTRDRATSLRRLAIISFKLKNVTQGVRYFEVASELNQQLASQAAANFRDRQLYVVSERNLAIAEKSAGLNSRANDRLRALAETLNALATDPKLVGDSKAQNWLSRQQLEIESTLDQQ